MQGAENASASEKKSCHSFDQIKGKAIQFLFTGHIWHDISYTYDTFRDRTWHIDTFFAKVCIYQVQSKYCSHKYAWRGRSLRFVDNLFIQKIYSFTY